MARPQTLHQSLPSLWRIGRRFWPYLGRQRRLVAGSLLALFAEVGLRLLEPWPLKFVFDHFFATGEAAGRPGIPLLEAIDPSVQLTLLAMAVVLITGLRALVTYFNTVGFALVANRVMTQVRADLYRHLQSLSLSFHTRARGGDMVIRVIGDVGLLREVVVTAVLPLLGNFLILVGMVGLMFWLHWQLALLASLTVPLFWFSTVRLSRRIQEVSRRQRQQEGSMASAAAESIGAIKTVQALSLEAVFTRAFASENNRNLSEGVKAKRLEAALERTVDVLIALATALVVWHGAQLVLRAALTPGDLLVFLAYLKNAFKPVRDFAKYTGRLAKATAAGERVVGLLEREPDIRDRPGAVEAPRLRGAVRFARVSFGYEPGRPVLDRVGFTVRPGKRVALVGPSGAGKTTLVNLVLRLYDPDEGQVIIDGRDIREYTLESLRAQIGVVLQDTLLFAASVRDNIAFGLPDATPQQIEAAARLANAHEFIEAMPEGYDTLLGERGVTLSNGQRQRIAIARAAVRNSPILILDEPTTGLDRANQQQVVEALERLARRRTTFVITHDLDLAARADVILYLEDGRILERGTHTKLMQANGRYAALFRLQAATMDRALPKKLQAVAR
jgi:ATP-binding cassette subfamily B protein